MNIVIACFIFLCTLSACSSMDKYDPLETTDQYEEDPTTEDRLEQTQNDEAMPSEPKTALDQQNTSDDANDKAIEQEPQPETTLSKEDRARSPSSTERANKESPLLEKTSSDEENTNDTSIQQSQLNTEQDPLDYSLPIDAPEKKLNDQAEDGESGEHDENKDPDKQEDGKPSLPGSLDKAENIKQENTSRSNASTNQTESPLKAPSSLPERSLSADDKEDKEAPLPAFGGSSSIEIPEEESQQHDVVNGTKLTKTNSEDSLENNAQIDLVDEGAHSRLSHKEHDLLEGSVHHGTDHSGSDHYHRHGNVIIKRRPSVNWNIQRRIETNTGNR